MNWEDRFHKFKRLLAEKTAKTTSQTVTATKEPPVKKAPKAQPKKRETPARAKTMQQRALFSHAFEAVKVAPHNLRQTTKSSTVNVATMPLTSPDVYRLFCQRVSLRYPHAIFPKMASAKDLARIKADVMCYEPMHVAKMIDALIAEWDRLRMTCFPIAPDLEYPHIEFLYRYRVRLVALISKGFVASGGAQRGRSYDPDNSSPVDKEMDWMLKQSGYREDERHVAPDEEIQMWE